MTTAQRTAKQYRIEQWSRAISDRAHSGKSVAVWCKENGVSLRVYYYRLRQVREYAAQIIAVPGTTGTAICEQTEPAFTEVKLLAPPPAHAELPRRSQLCIELGELRLTADSTYPAEELAALLRMLTRP